MQINFKKLSLGVLFVAAGYWLSRRLRNEGTSCPAEIDANLDPHLQDVRLRQEKQSDSAAATFAIPLTAPRLMSLRN